MEQNTGLHCIIAGRVQGVWFRASTQEQANALGLTGWVRNLADGRVEVLAVGPKNQIEKLHQWLNKGPALAQVSEVIYEEIPWEAHDKFLIK